MTLTLDEFTPLSAGTGGHYYLTTSILYQGKCRKLVVFFADKAEEQLMRQASQITIEGTFADQGPQQSLILREAYLLAWH